MKLQINRTSTIILYLMIWKRFFDSARLVNSHSFDETFGRTMKRIDFRTVWPIFNFWNASVVTIMVRDVQGVYYIALFLGVTYSQIVLYIFQSFLIDVRFISCFAKQFLLINHWMMQTMHVLHFVICVWLELIEVISSHPKVLPIPSRLLVSRRPF